MDFISVTPVSVTEASLCRCYEVLMDVFSANVVAGVGVTVTDDTDLSLKSGSEILLAAVEGKLVGCGHVCFMVEPAIF